MRFITEEEVRRQYQLQPFEVFYLEESSRLTPGSKQFLTDKQIPIKSGSKPERELGTHQEQPELVYRKLQLTFYQTALSLKSYDQLLAQEIMSLGQSVMMISDGYAPVIPVLMQCSQEVQELSDDIMKQFFSDANDLSQQPFVYGLVSLYELYLDVYELVGKELGEKEQGLREILHSLARLIQHLGGGNFDE
jgi:hypothetical protein